ncbi:hypothetical protein MRB53_019676 [Persea americana]|uniref:Uncharacterized protein n=1 Tax=Persea americana TaxID=3435 RepID=A0ACC2KZZ1_PERAE|nr:hypothetical protein MRB53_019676 [Persea americana]
MMAIRRLHDGGYQNLGWLAGGFNRSTDDDFPDAEGSTKLQYATVGGSMQSPPLVFENCYSLGPSDRWHPKRPSLLLRSEGFVLLDVQPVWEREKARVEGFLNVALFAEDTAMGPVVVCQTQ